MKEYASFFSKMPEALLLYEAVQEMIWSEFENVEVRVQKSQIAFSNRHNFAFVWLPIRKMKGRPDIYVVLSFGLSRKLEHPRIVESTEPYPGRWTHHVLIQSKDDVDVQVKEWLSEAYHFANEKRQSDSDKKTANTDMDTSRMTRQVYDIPDFVVAALDESGLWERYRARPPYQRNDYIGWITRGKREETRQKRLAQMLDELRSGDAYMGMRYNAK